MTIQRLAQFAFIILASIGLSTAANAASIRPPAVPLVACDPYFSIWSPADKLTDADTTHWTGKPHRLTSLVQIDGKTFRVMGAEPADIAALPQTGVEVLPTRTIYHFENEAVLLTLTFMTADLPANLDTLTRPVTYLTWEAQSKDHKLHDVKVYLDARSEMAVNKPDQPVTFEPADTDNSRVRDWGKHWRFLDLDFKLQTTGRPHLEAWRVGSVEQPVLKKKGDDLRIDWGYFYVATRKSKHAGITAATAQAARAGFVANGRLCNPADEKSLQNNGLNDSVIAYASDLGSVHAKPVSCWVMLAYDELYSIQYMKKNLRPYWRRNGDDAAALLLKAAHDYERLKKQCTDFDGEFMSDLRKAGGDNYAQLGALAFRQCFAAGTFVADDNGQPLQFCKENHSNGCISTSDVFYPMSPQFLLFGPSLAKSFIVPFMNYATSDRWKFPFAPHDLGTYPQANGQVYGDGERGVRNQMPVEESGNLLILFAAVAEMEGNANFANLYWQRLEQWAEYLKDKGFDPENQLCTDDFAGHLAHNVNLSVKAICGLGSFAKLCEMRGDKVKADEYFQLARGFAQRWVKEADSGDHYRLAFDRSDTWSQKYNLVWDRILGLNLFPASVAQKEMAFYKTMQNQYGLPLDNRKNYTKLDWITWTASLTQNRADFEALIDPVITFLNATPDRSPMPDWYQTKTAKREGFIARPVVGGVFLQMLYNKAVWQKYARRDRVKASHWAPMPQMPKPAEVTVVVPAADKEPATWIYTTSQPVEDWMQPGFDASTWQQGKSGFGTAHTPGAIIGTVWSTGDIWLRREIDLPAGIYTNVQAWLHHDEDVEVYLNGVPALRVPGFATEYSLFQMSPLATASLKPGKNWIAIHCHQTFGGQYVDLGLVKIQAEEQAAK